MSLGRQICGDWQAASRYEWLVTNGLGGYACGTLSGANTRRYHGFLMASLAPPIERSLLVAKIDVTVRLGEKLFRLCTNEFAGSVLSPEGFVHIESFAVQEGIPTWIYALDDALLQQQIFMAQGTNTSYLFLTLLRGSGPLAITLRPLVTFRDYHSHSHGPMPFAIDADGEVCRLQAGDGRPAFRLAVSQGRLVVAPDWYWNFWHRAEAERGLDASEDLFSPGTFEASLEPGQALSLTATLESEAPRAAAEVLAQLKSQAKALVAALPRTAPPWIRSLAIATNQFIVRRRTHDNSPAASIIAGYPWFADWGRDTMISLPGLATALRRFDVAANILRSYAQFLDAGMLPNRFPDGGTAPEYNTVDATLWMFQALDDYLHATRDPVLLRDLFPALMGVIRAHERGTRFAIGVDPADGLLRAGEPGTQLTWMDAKCGDHAFTPRVGKPVEINALWLNALEVMVRLAARLRAVSERNYCQALLARGAQSFARFWNPERGCLFDVLDVDGGAASDASVRPNQVLAVALPFCPLPLEQMRAVVELTTRELLTSYGLRSLSPKDPRYQPRYGGDAWQRDSAYHTGTVWAWLLGPFARAHFRVHGDPKRAQAFLAPLQLHLEEACLGTIGEIFDGDAPHIARGCFAQAWSVAEILRTWLYLERRISST